MNRSRIALLLCLLLSLSLAALPALANEPSAEALAGEKEVLNSFLAWGTPVLFPGYFPDGFTFTDAGAVEGDEAAEQYFFLYEAEDGRSYSITFSFLDKDAEAVQLLLTGEPSALSSGLGCLEDSAAEETTLIAARTSDLQALRDGEKEGPIVVYTAASASLDVDTLTRVLDAFGNG